MLLQKLENYPTSTALPPRRDLWRLDGVKSAGTDKLYILHLQQDPEPPEDRGSMAAWRLQAVRVRRTYLEIRTPTAYARTYVCTYESTYVSSRCTYYEVGTLMHIPDVTKNPNILWYCMLYWLILVPPRSHILGNSNIKCIVFYGNVLCSMEQAQWEDQCSLTERQTRTQLVLAVLGNMEKHKVLWHLVKSAKWACSRLALAGWCISPFLELTFQG